MKYLKVFLIIIIFIGLIISLTYVTMTTSYGCVFPEWKQIKNFSLSDYSCDKLREAITTNTNLYLNEYNNQCPNKDNIAYVFYDRFEIKDEYERRCLN